MRTWDVFSQEITEHKKKELQKIVTTIHQVSPNTSLPEMIILFGSQAKGKAVEDRYQKDHVIYEYQSDYDLLVVVEFKRRSKQERLEWRLSEAIQQSGVKHYVSVIVHDIAFINQALTDSQYFFSDIKEEGVLLYDSKRFKLGDAVPIPPKKRYEMAKEDFGYWFEKSIEFYDDAINNFKKARYHKSAFYLHQCVENLYHMMLLVFTHYKPKCHNLEKLHTLTARLDEQTADFWSFDNPDRKRLFKLLCEAYIDARYERQYTINQKDVQKMMDLVWDFQMKIKSSCLKKIQYFEKNSPQVGV